MNELLRIGSSNGVMVTCQLSLRVGVDRCVYLYCTSYVPQGAIQQLYIIPTPQAAYEMCTLYSPDCDKPYVYFASDFVSSTAGIQEKLLPPEILAPPPPMNATVTLVSTNWHY